MIVGQYYLSLNGEYLSNEKIIKSSILYPTNQSLPNNVMWIFSKTLAWISSQGWIFATKKHKCNGLSFFYCIVF